MPLLANACDPRRISVCCDVLGGLASAAPAESVPDGWNGPLTRLDAAEWARAPGFALAAHVKVVVTVPKMAHTICQPVVTGSCVVAANAGVALRAAHDRQHREHDPGAELQLVIELVGDEYEPALATSTARAVASTPR